MVPATKPATTQPNHHQLPVKVMVSIAAKIISRPPAAKMP